MAMNSSFSKTINKKDVVFCINDSILSDETIQEILSCNLSGKRAVLDMKKVDSINSKLFLDCLKNKKFKLFNLNTELLVYLSLVFKNGFLHSFMNYADFSLDKRELFKRRLSLV